MGDAQEFVTDASSTLEETRNVDACGQQRIQQKGATFLCPCRYLPGPLAGYLSKIGAREPVCCYQQDVCPAQVATA